MRRSLAIGMMAFLALPAVGLAAPPEDAAIQELQKQIQLLDTELADPALYEKSPAKAAEKAKQELMRESQMQGGEENGAQPAPES